MKQLLIDVLDRTHQFLNTLFDEHAGSDLLGWLAEHDPAAQWNAPREGEAP